MKLLCSGGLCYCGAQKEQPVQTIQSTSNGCGTQDSWYQPYISMIVDSLKLTPYCNNHDICYGTCNENKATCDQQFLQSMKASCTINWVNQTDIGNCEMWADRFYRAVNWFGGGAFEAAQKDVCTCN